MKRYVLMEPGLDYNDETYEIGGEGAKVLPNSYETIEEAEEALKTKLKDTLSNFDLMDFGWDPPRIASHYCDLVHNRDVEWGLDNWGNLIKWAEENNISWWKAAPQLLQIFEIEV